MLSSCGDIFSEAQRSLDLTESSLVHSEAIEYPFIHSFSYLCFQSMCIQSISLHHLAILPCPPPISNSVFSCDHYCRLQFCNTHELLIIKLSKIRDSCSHQLYRGWDGDTNRNSPRKYSSHMGKPKTASPSSYGSEGISWLNQEHTYKGYN